MKLFSTNRSVPEVSAQEAIFLGLPADNGLFMPVEIPKLKQGFWDNIESLTLPEIAFEIAMAYLGDEITNDDLKRIIDQAIDFEAPLFELTSDTFCLELFHGPSMAFKDFGARFMAGVMSHFLNQKSQNIHILVATSGDTGGAVAQGFYNYPNITVHILYPKGKVSDIQEKQLTTLGGNVKAIEVDGTFDDCQSLVKQAFLDKELRESYNLASANSINIARLIPQAFYYASTYAHLKKLGKEVVFSVPSGNFGNLCAGVMASKMGMPVGKFIAATNINKVVPSYLENGIYTPIKPSKSTISNAMDVGNPSNFPRLKELFNNDIELLKENVIGYWYDDDQTRETMLEIKQKYNYVVCPHTAIAYRALEEYRNASKKDFIGVFLATAHFAKFLPDVEPVLKEKLEIPDRLKALLSLPKKAKSMEVDYSDFKFYLNEQKK